MEFFEALERRRSVRKFTNEPLPQGLIEKAVAAAVKAPNSSNVQTWGFHWVRSPEKKAKLIEACLSQSAARSAAELMVITTNRNAWRRSQQRLINWVEDSKTHPSVINYYKKIVPFMYISGPFNILAPLKWLIIFVTGLFRPIMRGPITQRDVDEVAVKSAALAAENFVLAVAAQGADTCMMEGFDRVLIKRLLGLNCADQIVMVIAVGYRGEGALWGSQYRLPLDEVFKIY